jgi:hypothetical protein
VAITSATCDQISILEVATMAPLEFFKSDKFFVAPNTLAVERDGHLIGTHLQKTTLAAWRWDQAREPILRSPVKDEVTVLRTFGQIGQQMICVGTKKGSLQIYQVLSGALISEIDAAHYL